MKKVIIFYIIILLKINFFWYVFATILYYLFFQARLWKQVMNQLRAGVKLKKVDYTQTPLEYTLTPYEMLMEDIRSRR